MPRIHFQQQLAELKDKLLAMAALSQQAVESAVDAYLQRDQGLCQYVRQNETAINTAQRELDEMAYVRSASVYRRFQEATDFVQEVQKLEANK